MRKFTIFYLVVLCFGSMASLGYGLMLSDREVIEYSKNLGTEQEKTQYLLSQAQAFLDKDRFEEARSIAEYVKNNFQQNQAEAESIINQAQQASPESAVISEDLVRQDAPEADISGFANDQKQEATNLPISDPLYGETAAQEEMEKQVEELGSADLQKDPESQQAASADVASDTEITLSEGTTIITGENQDQLNSSGLVFAEDVLGVDVRNDAGEHLGKVQGLAINENSGKVEYAIIGSSGFMGLGGKNFAVSWDDLQKSQNTYHLNVSKQSLDEAQGLSRDIWREARSTAAE